MDIKNLDMSQALCSGTDTELFFPESGAGYSHSIALAKAICAECPITADCLQVALDNNYDGVWGGMTTLDRENFKRRMRRANRGRIHESAIRPLNIPVTIQRTNLRAANTARTAKAAARSVQVVKAALEVVGNTAPENLLKVAKTRLDNPTADLQQLADIIGVTKDSYAGSLRRFVQLASK